MSDLEIRRSERRKRTVSAHRRDGKTVVMVPAGLSPAQESEMVDRMIATLDRKQRRENMGDIELFDRACRLSEKWLGGQAMPASVRWVSNQNHRWGSCTFDARSIRLSDRLIGMPDYVLNFVLIHELVHLIEPNHSRRFHDLVGLYPHVAKAEGFLQGVLWRPRSD